MTPPPKFRRKLRPTNVEGLRHIADTVETKLREARLTMLAPTRRKEPPRFSPAQLMALMHISPDQYTRRTQRAEYPKGTLEGGRRYFTVGEVRTWAQLEHQEWQKPEGAGAPVLTVGQSKGGVTKSTTTVTLAHGMSLRGLKVLVIDMDPQGSATSLLHPDPRTITADHTLLPIFEGTQTSVRYAIQDTYWEGVSIIPAHPLFLNAEISVYAQILANSRQPQNKELFPFWTMLSDALADVKQEFDLILIDTPPSMSQSTFNAFYAADILLVPMPTGMMEYEASVHFWRMLSDFSADVERHSSGPAKEYKFIHVFGAMVDSQDSTTPIVKQWLSEAYHGLLMPLEIPKTGSAKVNALEYKTVYDITKYNGAAKTYARARDAYDRLVEFVAESVEAVWYDSVTPELALPETEPTAIAVEHSAPEARAA